MNVYKKILNNKDINISVKSISALHIIKDHSLYKNINFELNLNILKLINIILVRFNYLFSIFKNIFKKKKIPLKTKVLIITHLNNINDLKLKKDFYFGNLENLLKRNKKKCLKLMINHTDFESSYLNLKFKNKNCHILEKYLDFKMEMMILIDKIKAANKLLVLLIKNQINFSTLRILTVSLMGKQTTFSLRIYHQIKYFVRETKPDYCFLTYEGYSWERMCINGIKSINDKIKCIGYQHTPITNNHHALFEMLNGNFNPDKIWCSQLPSYKLLKKKINIKFRNCVKFIGNLNRPLISKNKKNKDNVVLVIPEGIVSECVNLFKVSLEIAKEFRNIQFIWRVHPVINFHKILRIMKLNKKNIPKNIKLSKNEFNEDAVQSRYAIYKGSAAVFKTVLLGNYPIYFKSSNEKNFDPLKNFFNQKNYFKNKNEFFDQIRLLKKKVSIHNKASKILNEIFSKPKEKKIIAFLK